MKLRRRGGGAVPGPNFVIERRRSAVPTAETARIAGLAPLISERKPAECDRESCASSLRFNRPVLIMLLRGSVCAQLTRRRRFRNEKVYRVRASFG